MATIYCFSSTGNSLYVAKRIAATIEARISSMAKRVDICNDDVIGFVFPTFFGGLPKTVEDFITKLGIPNHRAYIFAVATYGNFAMGVLGKVKELLEQKSCMLSYGKIIRCVENYIPGFRVNDNPEFQEKIEVGIGLVADEIGDRKITKVGRYHVWNRIIYTFYPANKGRCDKYFTIEDSCSKCRMCQKICPRKNIKVDNGKPIYNHDCELCLACLHICPVQSINWKNKTKGKKRYINPNITSKELTSFQRGILEIKYIPQKK